jgi:hypothetical protein
MAEVKPDTDERDMELAIGREPPDSEVEGLEDDLPEEDDGTFPETEGDGA